MWPKTSLLASPVAQNAPHPTSQLSKDERKTEIKKRLQFYLVEPIETPENAV